MDHREQGGECRERETESERQRQETERETLEKLGRISQESLVDHARNVRFAPKSTGKSLKLL